MSTSNDVKTMTNQDVSELLSEDYRRARVFRSYNIDFCCGGDRTLETVCESRDVDPETLAEELIEVSRGKTGDAESFSEMEPEALIDLVQEKHHEYTEEAIRRISGYLDRVRTVHGDNHPEILELADLWVELGPEMLQHTQREDRLLFPYARELLRGAEPSEATERPDEKSARELIDSMEGEHDETSDRLYEIKELTNGFSPPDDACTKFRALYSDLEEFVDVTMEHVFIENTILFPEIIDRENALQ